MTSGMSKQEYKEYFEKNNFKGDNYETAMFIKFLMEKKTKGKEIEEFTGMKHSQITSYKKIINSGMMEELKDKSISKVLKSIGKLDKGIIIGIEKLNLGASIDDSSEKEEATWKEDMKKFSAEFSNDYTDELELLISDLEAEVKRLNNEIKRLRRKKSVKEDEEQKKTILELKSENERLRSENTSLLPYKKFFEDMKGKIDSILDATRGHSP